MSDEQTKEGTSAACGASDVERGVRGGRDGEFWAYVTSKGRLIPSTVRNRRGDSEAALSKYRADASECKIVKVRIEIIDPNVQVHRSAACGASGGTKGYAW